MYLVFQTEAHNWSISVKVLSAVWLECTKNVCICGPVKYKYFFLYFCRIPGDLQQVVFNVAAQSDDDWAVLLGLYQHVDSDAEKRKIIRGLASTQNVRNIVM